MSMRFTFPSVFMRALLANSFHTPPSTYQTKHIVLFRLDDLKFCFR